MRQSALAHILSIASEDGEAFTMNITTVASSDGWSEAKFLFHHCEGENLLEVETHFGHRVYIDGDKIEAILVNK